jgi:hypothetical protein
MKFSFSTFSVNKLSNKLTKKLSKKICLFLMITLIAVTVSIIYSKLLKPHYKEGYDTPTSSTSTSTLPPSYTGLKGKMYNNVSNASDAAASSVESTVDFGMDQVSAVDNQVGGALDSILEFITEKKEIPPQWRDFYGDGEMEVPDVYKELPDTTLIINDTCSTKGFLNSEYKEDICVKYGANPVELNEKCKGLSNTNCKIPSCCILMDDKKCRAGNFNGPTFLQEGGKDIDFQFYYNKNKCYGKCDVGFNPLEKCKKYLHNSVGISKECMVQLFNNYGCSNPTPDYLINDEMVKKYSLSSRNYIDNYIKTEIGAIVKDKYNLDNIIKCKGQPFVVERYREFNTQLPESTPDAEIMNKLRTEGNIDFEKIFLNYNKV